MNKLTKWEELIEAYNLDGNEELIKVLNKIRVEFIKGEIFSIVELGSEANTEGEYELVEFISNLKLFSGNNVIELNYENIEEYITITKLDNNKDEIVRYIIDLTIPGMTNIIIVEIN